MQQQQHNTREMTGKRVRFAPIGGGSMMRRVVEFAEAAGDPFPPEPRVPTAEDTEFLVRMLLDEILELLSIHHDSQLAKSKLNEMIRDAKSLPKEESPTIASFSDGVMDLVYYSFHACSKLGIDMDLVFDEVHRCNMKKADPKTGKFNKRADGKILKPEGWIGPDIESALKRGRPAASSGVATHLVVFVASLFFFYFVSRV